MTSTWTRAFHELQWSVTQSEVYSLPSPGLDSRWSLQMQIPGLYVQRFSLHLPGGNLYCSERLLGLLMHADLTEYAFRLSTYLWSLTRSRKRNSSVLSKEKLLLWEVITSTGVDEVQQKDTTWINKSIIQFSSLLTHRKLQLYVS